MAIRLWHSMALCTGLALTAFDAAGALRFDPKRPLTSLHGPSRQNPQADLAAVLEGLLFDGSNGGPRAIVLYVHGRGNEPKKSFQDTMFTSGYVLEKLERQDISVLGYNWQSKIRRLRLCDRPVQSAREAASGLRTLIAELDRHKRAYPQRWGDRRVVLLAHSMGNIVVTEAMQDRDTAELSGRLFDTIVLSASDEPLQDHAGWHERIPVGKVYVLSNPSDRFLKRSMSCESADTPPRLGLTPASDTQAPRSRSSTYIEIPAGDRHRYISRGGQERNPHTCRVVKALLQGTAPPLSPSWIVARDPLRVTLPSEDNAADGCFGGAIEMERQSDKES